MILKFLIKNVKHPLKVPRDYVLLDLSHYGNNGKCVHKNTRNCHVLMTDCTAIEHIRDKLKMPKDQSRGASSCPG